jgi:hypothetical protein
MSYQPPPDLRARVLQATQERPSPTRFALERRRRLWLAAALVPPGLAALMARPWAISWPLPKVLALLASGAATAAGLSWLGRAGPDAMRRSRPVLLGFALGAPAVFLLLIALSMDHTHDGAHGAEHLPCVAMTLLLSVVPLLAGLRSGRGGDPVHPGSLGAAFGATAGALASVAATTVCRVVSPPHLLLAHGAPFLLVVAAGALLGGRWLALRSPPSVPPSPG